MFTEKDLLKNPALIKPFTGLPADVFWGLIKKMEEQLPEYERQRRERAERERAIGGGRHYDQSLVIRVMSVLTYMRLHAPQEAVASMYGATQSDISRDLRRLLPLIRQVLPSPEVWNEIADAEQLTASDIVHLEQLSDGKVIVDATEQVVYRASDNEVRKQYYSGKKKAFTLKTEIVTDGNHKIIAISEAVAGAEHDKKLSDKINTIDRLPPGCEAYMDKGYQGVQQQVETSLDFDIETLEEYEAPGLYIHIPFKKPKGQELTQDQKDYNRQVSSIRVRVEHCIGWVKNWGIIATRFRCAHSIYSLVMQVVCGLVNRQTERWQEASLKAA